MVKRTCYILLLFSHVLLAFLLIYVNCIHPEYEGPVGMITAIVVIIIWLTVPIILLKSQDYGHWNRLDLCLKIFA